MSHTYEGAGTQCASGPQPGSVALMDVIITSWDELDMAEATHDPVTSQDDLTSYGIFNCRNTRGGSTLSLHAEGRALDIKCNAYDSHAKAEGDALREILIEKSHKLGIQLIIFDTKIWSITRASEGLRPHTGSSGPHKDHLHVEQTWHFAKTLTEDACRRILLGGFLMALTDAQQADLYNKTKENNTLLKTLEKQLVRVYNKGSLKDKTPRDALREIHRDVHK